jgi:uncharacterized protein (TIGR03083 family)
MVVMDESRTTLASSPVSTAPPSRPPRLTPQEYLDQLDDATSRFAGLVAGHDLDAAVPSCPDWTLADLVVHLGKIHQWGTHAILEGNPDAHPTRPPTDPEALVDWYRESAASLARVLRVTDPHAPAWVFGPPPGTAAFWYRRQAHETTLHLWDAETSRPPDAGEPAPIGCVTALDGIDEVTGMFFPRQVSTGRIGPLAHRLALETTGAGGANRWVLAGDGTGPASAPDAEADAVVRGAAPDLFLLVWRRVGLDDERFALDGDVSAARAVLGRALTP